MCTACMYVCWEGSKKYCKQITDYNIVYVYGNFQGAKLSTFMWILIFSQTISKIEFKTNFIGEIISYVPGNVFVKSRKDVANYNFLTTYVHTTYGNMHVHYL